MFSYLDSFVCSLNTDARRYLLSALQRRLPPEERPANPLEPTKEDIDVYREKRVGSPKIALIKYIRESGRTNSLMEAKHLVDEWERQGKL